MLDTVSSAQECHNKIVYFQDAIRYAYISLGQELYRFENNLYFLDLGYSSFYEYAESPELDITYRTARRLVDVYKKFVLEMKFDPTELAGIGYSKLDIIRTTITEENSTELINAVKTLKRDDIRPYLKERVGLMVKPQIDWYWIATLLYSGNPSGKIEYEAAKKAIEEYRNEI